MAVNQLQYIRENLLQLSYEQMAKILGVSPTTLRVHEVGEHCSRIVELSAGSVFGLSSEGADRLRTGQLTAEELSMCARKGLDAHLSAVIKEVEKGVKSCGKPPSETAM